MNSNDLAQVRDTLWKAADELRANATLAAKEYRGPVLDGFVNWLTTHLTNAVGHAAVMRTGARINVHEGHEICRLDVARSSQPVWTKTSKGDRVFFVRMNNSTRPMPEAEIARYVADRWEAR